MGAISDFEKSTQEKKECEKRFVHYVILVTLSHFLVKCPTGALLANIVLSLSSLDPSIFLKIPIFLVAYLLWGRIRFNGKAPIFVDKPEKMTKEAYDTLCKWQGQSTTINLILLLCALLGTAFL